MEGEGPPVEAHYEITPPEADVCACDTPECMEAWVRANIGCNVCVTLLCEETGLDDVCVYCSREAAFRSSTKLRVY